MSKDQRRMERFIVIPFSSTCHSDSSVDVVDSRQAKKPQGGVEGAVGGAGPGKSKGESLVARLLKGFKNLSQIFAVYEDEEGEEREMVIGLPTDVKHVAHIGWDGSTNTTNSVRSWNRAAPPQASTSSSTAPPQQQQQAPLPAFSTRQFELAMTAQAAAGTATAATASTSTASTTTRHASTATASAAS